MSKKITEAFYTMLELVQNDPDPPSATYLKHFTAVVEALVNKETLSWRKAHEEMTKNAALLGKSLNEAENKLRKKSK